MIGLNDFPQKPESEPKSTRPRTAAQTAASRENGRQSKGPTTKSGLDRSKMNAVKHGLCGEFLLIYGESIRAYSALRDQFMHRFQPQDGIECSMVESLAETTWELARAGTSKRNSLMIAMDEERPFFDRKFKNAHHSVRITWAQQEQLKPGRSVDILERHIGRLERSFDRTFKQLLELRKNFPLPDIEPQTQNEPNEPDLSEPPVESIAPDNIQPVEAAPAAQNCARPLYQPLFGTSPYAFNVEEAPEEANDPPETVENVVEEPPKVRSAAA